jgi:hypothetical protein
MPRSREREREREPTALLDFDACDEHLQFSENYIVDIVTSRFIANQQFDGEI